VAAVAFRSDRKFLPGAVAALVAPLSLQGCSTAPLNEPVAVNVPYSLSTASIVQLPIAPGSWRVFSVGGHETPATGDYFITFADGRVAARFGCNSMGGSYRVEGDVIIVSDLAQTLIGCPEPAATFERDGSAILRSPMQTGMDPATGGPVLFNGSGRINLIPIVTGKRI
jgi:heat shock protein HslJ